MDPEQTFIRVQERFSQMLRPRIRTALEYIYLVVAITLFCILVVMHANYVQQPGCSSEFSGVVSLDAQLIYIKITGDGLLIQNESHSQPTPVGSDGISEQPTETGKAGNPDIPDNGFTSLATKLWFSWINSGVRNRKSGFKFWKSDNDLLDSQSQSSGDANIMKHVVLDGRSDKEEPHETFPMLAKQSLKAFVVHFFTKWHRRLSFLWWHGIRPLRGLWNIAGIHLNLDLQKLLHVFYLDRLNSVAVNWLERKIEAFEPAYLYTKEKGYFLLPEEAKARHNIQTANISISARHTCFGNRWQQLLINRVVGYDTILMNSLLSFPGEGYLYNYQTNEFYNLSLAHEPSKGSANLGDYLVMKCGVLMMSLFVFFTTTMSVSFTLRETQTRMLKFTVQLQHHARHRLPTFQLIFVHVIESLVFVPIMIGILFFLFEFYDDQLLAFMCAHTDINEVLSTLLLTLLFGFSHIFLFLCLRVFIFGFVGNIGFYAASDPVFLEPVPALQRFMQSRRSQFLQDFHITSSTILASTLHITRLNTRNTGLPGPAHGGPVPRPGSGVLAQPTNGDPDATGLEEQLNNNNQQGEGPQGNPLPISEHNLPQPEAVQNPGNMNSFSSLLLWILGGASSEGLNSFFSIFRDVRDQRQFYAETPEQDDHANQVAQEQH
ncbi:hypothetical protein V2J09_000681 [Rumex salicifolius]